MYHFRFDCLPLLLVPAVILVLGCSKRERENNNLPSLPVLSIEDTLSLQEACGRVSSYLFSALGTFDTSSSRFNGTLDSAAQSILKKNRGRREGQEVLDDILNLVYGEWDIGFDPRDKLIETTLPHLVLKNRKGSCLGVALIILMLAEKTALPVYGVMLPGHFFCRYDDGRLRINIEPNRKGCEHPEDYYIKRYPLENRPWYGMDNLDKKETVGMLCYNAGALCLANKKNDAAIALYREALRRIPDFAEAKGNCAIAFARKGDLDTALALFDTLFSAYPDMNNLAANYGYVAVAAKQFSRAVEVYKEGLRHHPDDTILQKRLKKLSSEFMFFPYKKKIE